MTDPEKIVKLTEKVSKLEGQVARLKKRLQTKMRYEKGFLKATGATPQLVDHIEQKDLAVLEE